MPKPIAQKISPYPIKNEEMKPSINWQNPKYLMSSKVYLLALIRDKP